MGNELAKDLGGLAKPPIRTADPGKDGRNGNPGNSRPADTATGRTANPGTGAGTGTATEEKKLSGLASVKTAPEIPTPGEPKKKQQRKPRAKKKDDSAFNAEQIAALLVSISSIFGSRPGFEMFTLSNVEAEQIATPLAKMIAKSEALSNAGEYADAIALVTACMVVFVPRFIIYFDTKKQKKIQSSGGVKLVRKETKNTGNAGKPVADRPANTKNDADSVFAAIPPVIY